MRDKLHFWAVAAGVCLVLLAGILAAQSQDSAGVLKGAAAFGDWRQDKPGVRRLLTPQDMPPALATKSATNVAKVVPMPKGAKPHVPSGFAVEAVVTGVKNPRAMRVAPNGDLFLADSNAGIVRVYRLTPGAAKPATTEVFASGMRQPYGIAFYPLGENPRWIYIAVNDGLIRLPYKNGDLAATGEPEWILDHIPWTHHWTRDVVVSADGRRLLYSVGSGSNVAQDMSLLPPHETLDSWNRTRPPGAAWDTEERRANVLSVDPEGRNERIVATGLRNCSGMAIQPGTGKLWCVVNERDDLGDNTPFEYATEVKENAFYGWPWYYIGSNEDPRYQDARPDLKDKVTMPTVLMQAHSAPLQIAFYEGAMFPAEYKGSAFVTMHGSWNRSQRTGYKVVRLLFKDGQATGEYEDFMTGFVVSDAGVWGRPVGVAVAKDGALLVSDDGSGTIWRVSYATTATSR